MEAARQWQIPVAVASKAQCLPFAYCLTETLNSVVRRKVCEYHNCLVTGATEHHDEEVRIERITDIGCRESGES